MCGDHVYWLQAKHTDNYSTFNGKSVEHIQVFAKHHFHTHHLYYRLLHVANSLRVLLGTQRWGTV